MRILIAGSRNITNPGDLAFFVSGIVGVTGIEITGIISGGAFGVDTLAEDFARKHNIPFTPMKPDWSQGRGAGIRRNTDMVNACDGAIVLWDGQSRGTMDTIQKVAKARKPLWVFTIPPRNETKQLNLEDNE